MNSRLVLLPLLVAAPIHADTISPGPANAAPGAVISLPFSFTNTHQIVGMQFDLSFPTTMVESGAALSPVSGILAESRELAPGLRRIVVFSATNQPLPDAAVLSVPLTL